jgi:transcriptional regulator with XRE-family HTH domain
MARTSQISLAPPAAVDAAMKRLGANIRTARLRRRLRIEDVARRVGVSPKVMVGIEQGKPTTALAAYLGALWALGLIDDIRAVADPDRDEEGKILERARMPKQARPRRALDNDF